MTFIGNTKIYIGMPVAICDNGGPQIIGWVRGGTKKILEVRTAENIFHNHSMKFELDKSTDAYVCKSNLETGTEIFLYFFGDMPYSYDK